MGNFFYYHILDDENLRQRVDTPEELLNFRDTRYKNIVYYYPEPSEKLPFFIRECGEEYSVPEKRVVRRVNLKKPHPPIT